MTVAVGTQPVGRRAGSPPIEPSPTPVGAAAAYLTNNTKSASATPVPDTAVLPFPQR